MQTSAASTAPFESWMSRFTNLSNEAQVVTGIVAILVVMAGLALLLRPRVRRRASATFDRSSVVPATGRSILVGNLLIDAANDFLDFTNHGVAWRATERQEDTGIPFVNDRLPRYFSGPFDAPLVLVHMIPKDEANGSDRYRDFDDYVERHRRSNMDATSRPAKRSQDFAAAFSAAERLDLYFLPYTAHRFDARKLDGRSFRREYERVMQIIDAYSREYVVFCGTAFERLLAPYLVEKVDHRFHVSTRDGMSKAEYRFSSVTLRFGQRSIPAAIAQSFTLTTTPMRAYGEACRDRYAPSACDAETRESSAM